MIRLRTLVLGRAAYLPFGTFGVLDLDGVRIYTVERAWHNNEPFVSCIPEGIYSCGPRPYFRGGYDAIEVKGVPRRTHILFHKANWPEQVAGCIAPNAWLAPGSEACPLRGVNSREAFDHLMQWAGGEPFQLEIKGPSRAVAPVGHAAA